MGFLLERLVDGLSLEGVFGLLACANALCWRANRSLILANIACFIMGAAVSLATISAAARFAPWLAPASLLIGSLAAMAAASAAGLVIRNASARAADDPAVMRLIPSAGLLLIALAAMQFAAQLPPPAILDPMTAPRFAAPVFGLTIPAVQPVIIVAAAAFIFAAWQLTGFTRFGRAQRAALQDPQMAELFGINTRGIKLICMLICCAMASGAGALGVIGGRTTDTNGVLLAAAIAFVAAALAGLRSIRRAAGGAVIAGLAVAFWPGYAGPNYGEPAVLAALLFLLIFAPAQLRGASEQF